VNDALALAVVAAGLAIGASVLFAAAVCRDLDRPRERRRP
jgi:hypothetical protein